MKARVWSSGLLGMAAFTLAGSAAITDAGRMRAAVRPGTAMLHAYGARSAAQVRDPAGAKFDATLADLARHVGATTPTVARLHAMSPAAKFQSADDGEALVLIDAVTRADARGLRTALEGLGLRRAALYANDVSGWLPVSRLGAAAALGSVHSLRASLSRRRAGAVTSQGDFAIRADLARTAGSVSGTGVTVGILSDSYNCYATYAANGVPAAGASGYASNGFLATASTDVSSGDLPTSVSVLQEASCLSYGAPFELPFSDEGRAMLQVVHDVAPGAALAFYSAENGEADFAAGIAALAKAGATVIADDIGYFDEPFFQDGIVAQAIDNVESQGVAYFSAAGNDGSLAYETSAPRFAAQTSTSTPAGEYLLNFDASGATTTTALPVTIAPLVPGEFVAVVLEWDQPYVTGASGSPGASSHLNLCVTGGNGSDEVVNLDLTQVTCTGANASGTDPVQVLIIANPASATGNTPAETLNLVVGLADGTAAPGRIKLAVEDDGAGSTINALAAYSSTPTVQGHPGAAGALAIGAAYYLDTPRCGTSPAVLESYSSVGGSPILFDTSGTRLATPVIRQKPDVVGPDGGNDTFLGFTSSAAQSATSIAGCDNDSKYPNFFGTSAATPHVAGVAALMRQANAALTPLDVYSALRTSAAPMGAVPNFQSGYGFVRADVALALVPPAVPTLTSSLSSVTSGGAFTLTWSSLNTSSCVAGGAWSGTLAVSGSQRMTATNAGTSTYTLTCSNAAGVSAPTSVAVSVAAAASGGGGGALDEILLVGLGGLLWSTRRSFGLPKR